MCSPFASTHCQFSVPLLPRSAKSLSPSPAPTSLTVTRLALLARPFFLLAAPPLTTLSEFCPSSWEEDPCELRSSRWDWCRESVAVGLEPIFCGEMGCIGVEEDRARVVGWVPSAAGSGGGGGWREMVGGLGGVIERRVEVEEERTPGRGLRGTDGTEAMMSDRVNKESRTGGGAGGQGH